MSAATSSSPSSLRHDAAENGARRRARRFLVVTISKRLADGVLNIGPSELNWHDTPFVCGTDICRDLREYVHIEMRRLRALSSNVAHQFVDFSFVLATCSLSEARLNFLCSNFYLDMCRSNFDKGLYDEVHKVNAPDEDNDLSEDDDACEYLDEEETRRAIGYIVVAHAKTEADEANDSASGGGDSSPPPLAYAKNFFDARIDGALAWQKWAGVRELCETLPAHCTFRSVAFYREVSGTSPYKHILLIELNRVMKYESSAVKCVKNIRPPSGVYIALYREIDFEIDLEALQTLVCVSRSVKCVGPSLHVNFSLNAKKNGLSTVYDANGVEGRDLDADMEVLEKSKKYSLGLLPKTTHKINNLQQNNDKNSNNYANDYNNNNNKKEKSATESFGQEACTRKIDNTKSNNKNNKKKNSLCHVKNSWHTVKNALKFVAKENNGKLNKNDVATETTVYDNKAKKASDEVNNKNNTNNSNGSEQNDNNYDRKQNGKSNGKNRAKEDNNKYRKNNIERNNNVNKNNNNVKQPKKHNKIFDLKSLWRAAPSGRKKKHERTDSSLCNFESETDAGTRYDTFHAPPARKHGTIFWRFPRKKHTVA